jgi:hypothetical protein
MSGSQASGDSFPETPLKLWKPLRETPRTQRLCGNLPPDPMSQIPNPAVAVSSNFQPQTSNLQILIDTIPKLESRPTPTKQTTESISNRYKLTQTGSCNQKCTRSNSGIKTRNRGLLSPPPPSRIKIQLMQRSPQNSNFSQPSPSRLGCGVYGPARPEKMR